MIGENRGFVPSPEKEKDIVYSQANSDDIKTIGDYLNFEETNNFTREDSAAPFDLKIKKINARISNGDIAVILARDGDKIIGNSAVTGLGANSNEAWAAKFLAGEIKIPDDFSGSATADNQLLFEVADFEGVKDILTQGYKGVSLLTPEDFSAENDKPIDKNYIMFIKN